MLMNRSLRSRGAGIMLIPYCDERETATPEMIN